MHVLNIAPKVEDLKERRTCLFVGQRSRLRDAVRELEGVDLDGVRSPLTELALGTVDRFS